MKIVLRRVVYTLCLAALPATMLSATANAAVAPIASNPTVIPLAASGCTGPFAEVCIDVEGTGLHVTTVKDTESINSAVSNSSHNWCGVLTYRITLGSSTFFSTVSPHGCTTQAHPSFSLTENVNASFPSGSLVCAGQKTDAGFYNPASGPACETLHS